MDQPTPQPAAPEDTVDINDLDRFVHALTHWHTNKVALMEHMKSVPEGSQVSAGDEPPLMLMGDTLKGFQLGLSLALSELGKLPFVAELEDEAEVAPVNPVGLN